MSTFKEFKETVKNDSILNAVLGGVIDKIDLPEDAPTTEEFFNLLITSVEDSSKEIIKKIVNAIKDEYLEKSIHQEIMDKAYEKWHENKDWNYYDFISNISEVERIAVLLGNMNYQIENGGLLQFFENGFLGYVDDIISYLFEVRDSLVKDEHKDVIDNVVDILETARDIYTKKKELERAWNEDYDEYALAQLLELRYTRDDIEQELIDSVDRITIKLELDNAEDYYRYTEDLIENIYNDYVAKHYKLVMDDYLNMLDAQTRKYYQIENKFLLLVERFLRNKLKGDKE